MKIKLYDKRHSIQMTAEHFIRIGRLLKQGYPLHTALTFIQLHVPEKIKQQYEKVLASLESGYPIHEAFQVFSLPPSLKSFLYFFEQQGNIAEGFIQTGSLLLKREQTKGELLKLLRYPILLLWLSAMLIILMYHFVLPHFHSFFAMVEIPRLSSLLLKALDLLPYLLFGAVAIFLCGGFALWIRLKQSSPAKRVRFLLALPKGKRYVQTSITYYFSYQLGHLLAVGLTLQQALSLFNKQDYLPFFQQECLEIMHQLHQGNSLDRIVQEKPYFRKELGFVIANGEKTGYVAHDLFHYSEMLYKEMEEAVQRILKVIQPALFVVVGGIIFLLFLATMLPLFQMVGVL